MALEGIGGSQPVDKNPYTMETLGIKEGSREASIFNQLDMADGVQHGYLTTKQYEAYLKIVTEMEKSNDMQKTTNEKDSEGIVTLNIEKHKEIMAKLKEISGKIKKGDFGLQQKDPSLNIPNEAESISVEEQDSAIMEKFKKFDLEL